MIQYLVPENDRKEILKYLSTKPYIEAAPLIGMLAQWKKDVLNAQQRAQKEKDKKDNGKDKTN